MTEPERSQALDRGVRLMHLLSDGQVRTIVDIANHLEVTRPVVYRMVRALEEHSWVHRTPDGRVGIGLGVLRLSAGVLPLVRNTASPILRQLAEKTGATAHLTVAEGNFARALIVVEPTWTDWHVSYRVGSSHPLQHGAAGRAILNARTGDVQPVISEGELQPGAVGVACAVPAPTLAASLGVVALGDLNVNRAVAVVGAAATSLGKKLLAT